MVVSGQRELGLRERLYHSAAFERLLEIIPGTLTWTALIAPFPLSFYAPAAVAYFIISFDLLMLVRWIRLSAALIRGYRKIQLIIGLNWAQVVASMEDPPAFHRSLVAGQGSYTRRQRTYLTHEALRTAAEPDIIPWREVWHLCLLANYKEGLEILEPAVRALAESDFPVKDRVVLVIAGEGRDRERAEANAHYLRDKYGHYFAAVLSTIHEDQVNEGRVKGANVSYAAQVAKQEFDRRGINPDYVATTVFDADTVVHKDFLAHLTFMFATHSDRRHITFQPIPFFHNNIWDTPAPSRLIATSSSFWQIIESTRPHRLRNFSSHTMSLATLAEIDYWDRFSINDDSRQFWRAYFAFHGHHQVVPLWVPVYNDAVESPTFFGTIKNQYLQLRRWAYGVSEIPFVVRHFLIDTEIPMSEKIVQTFRLIEGHLSWATAALFMSFVAWLPVVINNDFKNDVLTHTLPNITSNILTLGLAGLLVTIWLSLLLLPKRPAKYGPIKEIAQVVQWVLMPVTTIIFGSLPAIDAQTRLMFGRYLEWHLTVKSRKEAGSQAVK